jgi:hypothetical protein
MTSDAGGVAGRCSHYGAVFVGPGAAEVIGDYGIGPNHTLPTGGAGRFCGGLSVFNFLRIRTFIRSIGPAAREVYAQTAEFARLEGLEAHARGRGTKDRLAGPMSETGYALSPCCRRFQPRSCSWACEAAGNRPLDVNWRSASTVRLLISTTSPQACSTGYPSPKHGRMTGPMPSAEQNSRRSCSSSHRPGGLSPSAAGTPTAPGASQWLDDHAKRGDIRLMYLAATADQLRERLRAALGPDRPSLTGGDPLAEIDRVLADRDPLYRRLATHIVEVGAMSESQALDALLVIAADEPSRGNASTQSRTP